MALTKSLKDYLMREEVAKIEEEWERIKQAREALEKQQNEIEQQQRELEQQWAAINAEWDKIRSNEKPPDKTETKPIKKVPQKVTSTEEIRIKYPKAYEKWTFEEDNQLTQAYLQGTAVEALADEFQRQPGAILARLQRLNLIDGSR